jgi:hypothetical protein
MSASRRVGRLLCLAFPAILFGGHELSAQFGGGGFGGGGGGAGGVNAQGVYVDAEGVLRTVLVGDPAAALEQLRRGLRVAKPAGKVASKSALRYVSLARLAREVQDCLEAGKRVPDELRFLGGITQLQFVFVYPDEKDIVIAGPAEAWEMDGGGRVLGATSKRPVLWLDDLVTALRVFPPDGKRDVVVGCSINQTDEGVRRLNSYLASLGAIDARQVNAALVQGVREALGLHNIEVWGVPDTSRMAMTLVEADYRMKLIGIGLENPRVRGLTSYVAMMGAGDGGTNKMQRWWLVPEYSAIVESTAGDAFEFQGPRAKLLAADDKLKVTGQVIRQDTASATNRRFSLSFSKHYEQLARVSPVFAELQNAFDLLMLAAIAQQRDWTSKLAPDLAMLLDAEDGYVPATYPAPRHSESVVNTKWIGNKLAIPVGGGVVVETTKLLSEQLAKADAAKPNEGRKDAAKPNDRRDVARPNAPPGAVWQD